MPQERISYKRIIAIAFPIILSQLAQNLVAIADTMFLGNVGETELAAAALGTIFYQTIFMFMWGFGVGTQITIARVRGENSEKSVGRIFQHSLFFMLCASLLILLLYNLFGRMFMGNLVSSKPILTASMEYLDARIWGLPFALICASFMAFYIGIARTRIIILAAFLMAATNVIFDYLLIFGYGGFPEMGIAGAGWASAMADFVWLAVLFIVSLKKENNIKYRLYRRFPLHKSLFGRLLKISYPTMLQFLISFGMYFVFFTLIESMGQRSLAISNITRSCYTVFLMPIWGFTSTVATLTAYLLGKQRTVKENINVNKLINILVLKSMLLAFTFISITILPFFVFSDTLFRLFTPDASLINDSLSVVLVVATAAYPLCLAQLIFNVVIGHEKTKQAFVIEMITIVFYVLYTFFIIKILHSSLEIAWTAEYLYSCIVLILSLAYLIWLRWRGKRNTAV